MANFKLEHNISDTVQGFYQKNNGEKSVKCKISIFTLLLVRLEKVELKSAILKIKGRIKLDSLIFTLFCSDPIKWGRNNILN